MFGFDTSNSIEPAAPTRPASARKADPAEMPIREATPAEMRAMKSRPGPHDDTTDTVARKHNFYVAERKSARIYYTDYQQKSEVMRAVPQRISTRLDDRQTVSAMLDLAQSRGWASVKLRGTDDFRREAWVQAQVRGIAAEGYKPKETDIQEAARRQAAAKPVEKAREAPATKPETKPAQPVKAKAVKPVQVSTPKPVPVADGKAAQTRQAAVWGSVEAAGKQARENDAPASKPVQKPAQTPTTAAA